MCFVASIPNKTMKKGVFATLLKLKKIRRKSNGIGFLFPQLV